MIIRRTEGKFNSDYNAKSMYEHYIELMTKNKEVPVDYKTYRKITKFMNKLIVEKMINENFVFVMPHRTGNLSVRKYKPQLRETRTVNGTPTLNFPVDWKATKEMWLEEPELKGKKVIYIDNEHTNGYRYKFQWNVYNAVFKNKKMGGLKPLRKISRQLAKAIKTNDKVEYFEFIKRY